MTRPSPLASNITARHALKSLYGDGDACFTRGHDELNVPRWLGARYPGCGAGVWQFDRQNDVHAG
jgi:2-keto-3-deoxy-6-phosphogluconate aldolase